MDDALNSFEEFQGLFGRMFNTVGLGYVNPNPRLDVGLWKPQFQGFHNTGWALKIFHFVCRFISLVVLLQPVLIHLIKPVSYLIPPSPSISISLLLSSFFFFFFLPISLRFRFHFLLVAVWSSISISISILIYEEKAGDLGLGELIDGDDSSVGQIFHCNITPLLKGSAQFTLNFFKILQNKSCSYEFRVNRKFNHNKLS